MLFQGWSGQTHYKELWSYRIYLGDQKVEFFQANLMIMQHQIVHGMEQACV